MTTLNREGWPNAAFAETLPVVYTIDAPRAQRGAPRLRLWTGLVRLARACQAYLVWLWRACEARRPPPP